MSVTYLKRAAKGEMPAISEADVLDGVHRSADRMRRLVDDLLDAFAAAAKAVRVALNAPEGEHLLTCDRDRLTQVLCNLLGNAVKFSPDAGVVEVTLAATDVSLRVAVRDWGRGISAAQLPHLFTPYWQAAETAHLGTGLVDSRVGEGTTFSITLPR